MSKSTVIMRVVMLWYGVTACDLTKAQVRAAQASTSALTVPGTITDVQNNEPLPGVTVHQTEVHPGHQADGKRRYLFPIPEVELNKNSNLTLNPDHR